MAVHTEDPQRELQKLHLLQAMGLRLYLPRYRLPGAAPSRVIPWGTPASSTAAAEGASDTALSNAAAPGPRTTVPGTSTQDSYAADPPGAAPRQTLEQPPPSRAAPRIIVDDIPPTTTVGTHTSPARATPAERDTAAPGPASQPHPAAAMASSTASDPMARFQALLLPLAGPVAVLALVPAVARLQLPERERRLLQGILHWLGVSEAATQAPRPFQWPLPGLPEAGVAQAGVSLNAFLDQARRELGFTHLLIFGEPLQAALGATATNQDMVATYSLQQMTTVPALKRECWLALQPLQRILADERQ